MRLDRAINQEKEKSEYENLQKESLPEVFECITKILEEHLMSQDPKEIDETITNYVKSVNHLNKSTSSNDNKVLNTQYEDEI